MPHHTLVQQPRWGRTEDSWLHTGLSRHGPILRSENKVSHHPVSHLITVGVISAQKNTLRLPTAWDANIPTMENAMENLSLTLSLIPGGESREGDHEVGEKGREQKPGEG